MKTSFRAILTSALIVIATSAWAHVVVTPKQAGVASWVTFNVSVPNEKDISTVALKLQLPEGLGEVSPTVKPGWTITIEKSGDHATAIVWKGQLPAGFRDDFTFSAQVPSQAGELDWKAYQTYQGNEVVGWDVDPSSPDAKDPEALEKTNKGPYSITKVVDDLTGQTHAQPISIAVPLSIVAVVLSLLAAVLAVVALRRR
jgi:uncharacterized protein YcnI